MRSTLYYNGVILTQNPAQPEASAMVVGSGKITWVGFTPPEVSFAERVDLHGRTLMPGFNDAHIHLWKVGQLAEFIIDLRGIGSIAELQKKVSAIAQRLPAGKWIVGRGFNEAKLADGRMPTAIDLDSISSHHPIYLIRTCAHIAVANSLAMQQSGVSESTLAPEGGVIGRDHSGNPDGRFYETALGLITRHIPPVTQEEYGRMIEAGVKLMLANGITSVTDPAVHPELLQAYQTYASGDPEIRVNAMPILLPDGGDKPFPVPPLYRSEFLQVDTVKFFSDGGLSGKTAALSRTYKNSNDHGVLRLSFEKFYALARDAQQKGFRVGTHAIGDTAIGLVLDVYRKLYAEFGDRRNRLEHFGLPIGENIEEVALHRFVVVTQPVFLGELGENFIQALDEQYLSGCYPVFSLIKNGIPVAFSTDAPVVTSINPWYNIQCAMLRQTQSGKGIAVHEAVTLFQSLVAYTSGSAYAEGNERVKGMIAPGYLADFIILQENPYEKPLDSLQELKVEETYVAGICRWQQGFKD